MTGLWIFIGVLVVLAIFQRNNLRMIMQSVFAQFGKFARWVRGIDPIAMYQAEVDRCAAEIQQGTEGLEQYRGLVSQYQRKVANGEADVARLDARIKAQLQLNNEDKASQYVMQLNRANAQLEADRKVLERYNSSYQANAKKIKAARDQIVMARERAREYNAELRLSQVEAEAAQLAARLNVKSANFDNFGELEAEIQRKIDVNRAKAQVIVDTGADGMDDIEEKEVIEQSEAKAMLEKYKSEMTSK